MKIGRGLHQPDYTLIIVMIMIVGVGLILLWSASAVISYQKFQDSYYYLKHQILFGLIPGVILLFLCSKINYNFFRKISFILFLGTIILLLLVFVPEIGYSCGKTRSWLKLGGISFQPSELLKIALIIYLAAFFEKQGKKIKSFSQGFLPFIFILGIVALLLIMQPDIGTLGIVILIALVIYFVAGAKIGHLFLIILAGALGLFLLIKTASYRMERFMVFLNPSVDPQGIGYHINQALIGIGSGGMFGVGLGHSRQKFAYLPEVYGDSIFAIIAEELGFILTVGLIILFVALAIRGFKIAKNAPDKFSQLVAVGITSWIIFQTFINIMAMIGLIPLTGLPLPFISYGGSALAVLLASMGILINISKQTVR